MQKLVSFVILLAGVAGIVFPAFFSDTALRIAMQVISAFFVLCVVYIEIVGLWFRRTPLTVVRSSVNFKISDDFRIAECTRKQIIRANKPNVTAYYASSRPGSSNGRITNLKVHAYCTGAALESNIARFGDERKGYELLHSFGRNLRYRFWMPLIPAAFLNREKVDDYFGFVGDNLLVRTQMYTYEDEYNVPHPRMKFTVDDYPQHNVEFHLTFDGGVPSDLKVKRIKPLGVIDVDVRTDISTPNTVFFKVKKLKRESLFVYWNQ